jgi:hypothetical protein
MRTNEVILETEKWKGESISFWFRTTQSTAQIASITNGAGRYLRIYLKEGETLQFIIICTKTNNR